MAAAAPAKASKKRRAQDELAALVAGTTDPPSATKYLVEQLELPRVGVAVLVTSPDHAGKVLVGERKGSHGAGCFALPGGHLEAGEPWAECAVRELEEETGLVAAARTAAPQSVCAYAGGAAASGATCTFVAVTNDPMPADDLHYVTLFVSVAVEAGATAVNAEPDKCAGWQWMTLAEIAALPEARQFVPMRHLAKLIARGLDVTALAPTAP